METHWYFLQSSSETVLAHLPDCAVEFSLDSEGEINLDDVYSGNAREGVEGVVYCVFELSAGGPLWFGAGCDWWWSVYLNGEELFATGEGGNVQGFCSSRNHVFSGMGKAGRNLLVFKVKRGSRSWDFACRITTRAPIAPSESFAVMVDPGKAAGPVRRMNGVNNGPVVNRLNASRSNLAEWKAARIPFSRNHDASFYAGYGGAHTVDVHVVFPDFDAAPEDSANYDFALTDKYLQEIEAGGTKVFYRLGSKIEHEKVKYGTKVPQDFKKWAVICEHLIRHFNEGWANGFHLNIEYWEIWNEPDSGPGSTWQGTPEEFFELYRVAASHLKACFPALKIGGPALAGNQAWMKRFLAALNEGERAPLDFFSWHCYSGDPNELSDGCRRIRKILDSFGFEKTESILNEWNYCRGFSDDLTYTLQQITRIKGAVFISAAMSLCQRVPVDMLMYYDARPCLWNGIFDSVSFKPIKGYYPFWVWGRLADLGQVVALDTGDAPGVSGTAAKDGKGNLGIMLARFFDDDASIATVRVTLSVKDTDLRGSRLFLLDNEHNFEDIPYRVTASGDYVFDMPALSMVYLEKAVSGACR